MTIVHPSSRRRRLQVAVIAAALSLAWLVPAFGQEQHLVAIPKQVPQGPKQQTRSGMDLPSTSRIPGKPETLTPQRFDELGYGLSFREPANTYKVLQTADGALVKYLFPHGATISFYVRQSGKVVRVGGLLNDPTHVQHSEVGPQAKPLTLQQVQKQAISQFGFAYPSAGHVKDPHPKIKIAGRPGVKLYFVVPDKKHGDWVAGQAFMLIDGHTVAMFQMQCQADRFAQQKKLFESLLASAKLEDPQKLNARRSQQLAAGFAWLKTITDQRINQALHKAQWFRITENNKDIGYERIIAANAQQLGEKGVRVSEKRHIDAGNSAYVSLASYFASRNGAAEVWSVQSARHDNTKPQTKLPSAGKQPQDTIWTETGIRSGKTITVTRQTPSKQTTHHWEKPANGYLSQVAARLLMGMLPHKQAERYAFYAYDSNTEKVALRLVWVKPLDNGRFQVTVRHTPDRAPRVSIYDRQGQLLQRQLPDGRVLLRTTPDQLRKIWHIP